MSPSAEPFDQSKYKDLTDGLECSELMLSELESGTRIDSELYQKKYAILNNFSKSHRCTTFSAEADVIKKGIFDISAAVYSEEGVPFVRISNIKGMLISEENLVCIPDHESLKNSATELKYGDLVLSKTGSPAAAYINLKRCNVSQDTVAIKLKPTASVLSEYVVVYLNSIYGFAQLEKRFTGNIQMHLNLDDCKNNVVIPVFGEGFQQAVAAVFQKSVSLKKQYKKAFLNANRIFESQLAFSGDGVSSSKIAIRPFSESFLGSGRLDAEYYQPKYDAYREAVCAYKNGFSLIKNEFDQVVEKCDRTKPEYPYVEIGDVDIDGGKASCNIVAAELLPANARIMTRKGDVLVSTVRPNRGAVAILDSDNLLVSGAFTVLREKSRYKKEVLQTLLRTKLYRDWLLRYNVGTSYPVIKDEDVLNMPIPLLDSTVQDSIAAEVEKALSLRRRSEELLECAKQAVELAVEQGEDAAMARLSEAPHENDSCPEGPR